MRELIDVLALSLMQDSVLLLAAFVVMVIATLVGTLVANWVWNRWTK